MAARKRILLAITAVVPVMLATGCLGELRTAPHVVVRVHESLHEQVHAKLKEIAAARGFEGRLVVLGETEIAPGDCRLEWADGGVVRDRTATQTLIDEAVARYIAARRLAGGNNDEEES